MATFQWPEHVANFTTIRIAVQHGIQLIVWAKPQTEYGSPASASGRQYADAARLEEFAAARLRVSTYPKVADIEKRHLISTPIRKIPTCARRSDGIFLGYYSPWDGLEQWPLTPRRTLRERLLNSSERLTAN